MAEFTSYPSGTPAWVDLATPDPDDAKRFYSGLFGWDSMDLPTDRPDRPYTMFTMRGRPVAALMEMAEQLKAQGMPPVWTTYIATSDVTASAERAAAAGGVVVMPPMDVMDSGKMALVQDPTGATFGLWQAGTHFGAGIANEPGSFSWNELQTHDTGRAAQFYADVFGWVAHTTEQPGGPYTSFKLDDRDVAGMMEIRPEWGEVPPNWGVYFTVADCDESVTLAGRLGGKVEVPAMDLPGIGRMALLVDPQGGHFYVISGM